MKKTYEKPTFVKTSYISIDNMAYDGNGGYGLRMENIEPDDDLLMTQYGVCKCKNNIDDCDPPCSCV